MSSTHTVRGVLHVEVPTLNCALHSFAFADGLGVDVLADLKMARPQYISNGKKVFRGNWKFSQCGLGWKIIFEQMSDLGLFQSMRQLFADSKLNRIDSVFFFSLNLRDLTSIYLNHRARCQFAPFVPKVCHAHFVAHQADPFRQPANRRDWRDGKVLVNIVFERFKGPWLVRDSVFLCVYNLFIVQAIRNCKRQILSSTLNQARN